MRGDARPVASGLGRCWTRVRVGLDEASALALRASGAGLLQRVDEWLPGRPSRCLAQTVTYWSTASGGGCVAWRTPGRRMVRDGQRRRRRRFDLAGSIGGPAGVEADAPAWRRWCALVASPGRTAPDARSSPQWATGASGSAPSERQRTRPPGPQGLERGSEARNHICGNAEPTRDLL